VVVEGGRLEEHVWCSLAGMVRVDAVRCALWRGFCVKTS
jgi:hypothetical protein